MRNLSTIQNDIDSEEAALETIRKELSKEELALKKLKQQLEELKEYMVLLANSHDQVHVETNALDFGLKDAIRQGISGEAGGFLANSVDSAIEKATRAKVSISDGLSIGKEDKKRVEKEIINKEEYISDLRTQYYKKESVIVKLRREFRMASVEL